MFNLKVLGQLVQGAAESYQQRQQQQLGAVQAHPKKQGCTPCEAIASVEAERKKLGFKR